MEAFENCQTLCWFIENGVNPFKWRVDGVAPFEILSGNTPLGEPHGHDVSTAAVLWQCCLITMNKNK